MNILTDELGCPIIGRIYFYFDDGKIRESRRSKVLITDIIPFDQIDNETKQIWKDEVEQCKDWGLYDETTDFFIKGSLQEENQELIFVRSKGGWFSFGNYMYDGRLDHDGSLNMFLKANKK